MKTKSLYISSLEPAAGSLIVSMGMMEILKKNLFKVAFFRPVIIDKNIIDSDIEFMLEHYNLDMSYERAYGFDVEYVEAMISQNRENELFEELIDKFKKLEKKYDFVLCEGLGRAYFSSTISFDINLRIAQNFGSSYVSVINAKDRKAKDIFEEIKLESDAIKCEECLHFATFVNRLSEKNFLKLNEMIKKSDEQIYLLEEIDELDQPTVGEIKDHLAAADLFVNKKDLSRVVKRSRVAALGVDNFLTYLEDGDLVIVPGDRSDVILGIFSSLHSKDSAKVAGIVLTFNMKPHKNIMKLIRGFKEFHIPMIMVDEDTYTTARTVDHVKSKITAGNDRKVALALGLFFKNVDSKKIESKIDSTSSNILTPMMFEYSLFERARSEKKRIVLPESKDDRILKATEILLRRDIVDVILLGNKQSIKIRASKLGLDISKATIIDPSESKLQLEFSQKFYELRAHKGLSLEAATDAMSHNNYFATMMVHLGFADGMVSGAIHTTGDTIRPALQIIKTKPNISIVSSVFFMCLETRVLVYGDCAVNQDPTARELAEIAISSATSAKMFGIEPLVAMLSYSTGKSGSGADVDKVIEATKIAKELESELLIEGPIQYDAAIDENVAKLKLPDSKVAGKATVFIFPDLNTGNNTYKAVQRSSKAIAIGPILQGLNKPVNDLSRGCEVADIVNTVAITAIQAQEVKK